MTISRSKLCRPITYGMVVAGLFPTLAEASELPAQGNLLLAFLLLQLLPLPHIIISKRLNPCYKTGYCTLYLALTVMAWFFVLVLPAFLPNPPSLIVIAALGSPLLFWVYAFTLGDHIRGSAASCDISRRNQIAKRH